MAFIIVIASEYEFASTSDEDGEAIDEFITYMRYDGIKIAVRFDWENYVHLVWINNVKYELQTLYIDEPCMINRPGDRE